MGIADAVVPRVRRRSSSRIQEYLERVNIAVISVPRVENIEISRTAYIADTSLVARGIRNDVFGEITRTVVIEHGHPS